MTTETAQRVDELIDFAIGKASAGFNAVEERRSGRRYSYEALAAALWQEGEQVNVAPVVIHCQDISIGGLRVWSSASLSVGQSGAVQLVRPTGKVAIVGVRVQHCREVAAQRYEAGLSFCPLGAGISARDFLNSARGLPLCDSGSRTNDRTL